jgi:hypothetical protein
VVPETKYAKSGELNSAYQVIGEGELMVRTSRPALRITLSALLLVFALPRLALGLCPGDCDERCGVDGCQAGEYFRCPIDCPPPPCTTTSCGGVCAPRPNFTLSNPYPLENEPVAFAAFPNLVDSASRSRSSS